MKFTLSIFGSLVFLFFVGCSKDRVSSNGYDSSFIDLVDHDSTFIGDWRTATQGEEFYLYFDIPEQGNSHFIYDYKSDNQPPVDISKIAKYFDGAIYLEEEKKIQIDQFPVLTNDTVEQYNFNGPIRYVYSAIMKIDSHTLYRVDEIID